MRILTILIFWLITNLSLNGNSGLFIEEDTNSCLKIYFDVNGKISTDINASFYRIIDKSFLIDLTTEIRDYYINDKLAFKGKAVKGIIQDSAIFYFENGEIKAKGNFANGNYTGIWHFYYDNGALNKILDFSDEGIKIIQLYKKNGKTLINNGSGGFKDKVLINSINLDIYEVSGNVKNGNMVGTWMMFKNYSETAGGQGMYRYTTSISFVDRYNDIGEFLTGSQDLNYTSYYRNEITSKLENKNKIHYYPVIKIVDFNPHIELNLFETIIDANTQKLSNIIRVNGNPNNFFSLFQPEIKDVIYYKNTYVKLPYYNGKQNLNLSFLPFIAKKVEELNNDHNQGLILCQFRLDAQNKISDIFIYQGEYMNSKMLDEITDIINTNIANWIPASIEGTKKFIDSYLYIPLYYQDSKLLFGQYKFGLTSNMNEIFNLLDL